MGSSAHVRLLRELTLVVVCSGVGQQQRPQDVGVHGSGKAFPHCGERCWFAGFPACNLPHIARCSFWTLANTSKSAVLVASETLWCADSLKSSRRSQGRSTTSFMDAERPFRSESKVRWIGLCDPLWTAFFSCSRTPRCKPGCLRKLFGRTLTCLTSLVRSSSPSCSLLHLLASPFSASHSFHRPQA